MRTTLLPILFLLVWSGTTAQINFTANDQVKPYALPFGFGANMGFYNGWTDDQLADIAVGNQALGIDGCGINTLRPLLPEYFLEDWSYDIRKNTFQHYSDLGASENVAIIGYPSEIHRDPTQYCPGVPSEAFANMYAPIWDNGENNTPVNDQNYYALYVYKMVNIYGDHIRFYEVTNEPDLDFSGNGWKDKNYPESWFNTVPSPCDYDFGAPITHYVRMLRISYEVIKTLRPDAYVAVGGLGYPSFLDLILRHTDNPDGGMVSNEYPQKGGAYFDVLSYHSYPHIDGSLRYYNNEAGFVYERNSDRAVKGVFERQKRFQEVLSDYGYDGTTYPEKEWIITESNIPRKGFNYFGSNEAQRNFLIKALAQCEQKGIHQFHIYTMSDLARENEAWDEFQTMGLYRHLSFSGPYNQVGNDAAIAYKTSSELFGGFQYSAGRTASLQLPDGVRGIAFNRPNSNHFTYVLWAEAKQDMSESANATYDLPSALRTEKLTLHQWDYSDGAKGENTDGRNITLTGTPVFITDGHHGAFDEDNIMELFPNPTYTDFNVRIELPQSTSVSLYLYDALGRKIRNLTQDQMLNEGFNLLSFSTLFNTPGIYFLKLKAKEVETTKKIVILGN